MFLRFACMASVLLLWCAVGVARAEPCTHDDALARAAARLSLEPTRPSPDAILQALRAEHSDRVSAHMLWLDADSPARVQAWLGRLRARTEAQLVCGEAFGPDRIVLIAAERAGALTPSASGGTRLVPTLAPDFSEPYVVFRAADGELRRLGLSTDDFERGFQVPADLAPPVEVQLVASGPSGPRPVAARHVAPRVSEARALGSSIQPGESVSSVVAALREAREVSPLRPNRLLARVARHHAEQVCRAGRVVHRLDDEGDPRERLLHAGISARVVGEAAARASTIPEALSSLAESPSHLMAIVDRRFTDGGYGVASDARGRRCVVVLLAAWPRAVPVRR